MWHYGGYEGDGCEELLGTQKGKTALIFGNAITAHSDWAAVPDRDNSIIFGVNDVGVYLPKIHHWVSLHPDKLEHWIALRKIDAFLWNNFNSHTTRPVTGLTHVWKWLSPSFGLSGYAAMQIAYLMGFDKIILCGCPGDATKRFFDFNGRRECDGFDYQKEGNLEQLTKEMKRVPEFKAKVRSMSGFTKEFFGGIDNG